MYIIIWRHTYREPHVGLDSHYFLESYSSYEEAEKVAKEICDSNSEWYYDYAIFKEVTN